MEKRLSRAVIKPQLNKDIWQIDSATPKYHQRQQPVLKDKATESVWEAYSCWSKPDQSWSKPDQSWSSCRGGMVLIRSGWVLPSPFLFPP